MGRALTINAVSSTRKRERERTRVAERQG